MTQKNLFGDIVVESDKDKESKVDFEKTPHYDIVSVEARKYIIGGAAKFIPDLCYALKRDWFQNETEAEIRHMPEKRNRIKHKVLEEWCNSETSDKLGWGKATIWRLWPDLVRVPEQEETEKDETELAMRDAYLEYANTVNTLEAFPEFSRKLPSVPEEIKVNDSNVSTGPHKQKLPSPHEIYAESMDAFKVVWTYLFNYKGVPGPNIDINSEIIGTTQRHHLRILKGLSEDERRVLIHQAQHMHTALIGFLKRARDVQAEEKRTGK